MNETPLRQRATETFSFALERSARRPALKSLHHLLEQAQERLNQPMRVAVVGLIKAGKSTMMNALLGEAVVATGTVEATFNVNWLRYGDTSGLLVHFKEENGQTPPPEAKSLAELTALTLRGDKNKDYLLKIKYIEVTCPNPLLKIFHLIDTPGLASYYQDDSQNTKDFLKLHGQELTQVTQAETSTADAVLYLFSHNIAVEDAKIVHEFQGVGHTTPINAIGVLTKVDAYWSDDNANPLEAGQRISSRLLGHPQVSRLFYSIRPVCGLLALGAQTLTPTEYETLRCLATLPPDRFEKLLKVVERFATREYPQEPDIPPAPARQQVAVRLGQYGVWLACDYLRHTSITDREKLAAELLRQSGVAELRNLIISHFGNRAFLIKLNTGLRQIASICFQERYRQTGMDRRILEEIAERFEALEAQEHAFHELQVLRNYYEEKLNFSPEEIKLLLEITGEYGISCGERLGLSECATIPEMLGVAEQKKHYWQLRANDFLSTDRATLQGANVLARSYERIIHYLHEARKNLYL